MTNFIMFFVAVYVISSITKSCFLKTTFLAGPSHTKYSLSRAFTQQGKLITHSHVSFCNTCANTALSAGAENTKLPHVYIHGVVTYSNGCLCVFTQADVVPLLEAS